MYTSNGLLHRIYIVGTRRADLRLFYCTGLAEGGSRHGQHELGGGL